MKNDAAVCVTLMCSKYTQRVYCCKYLFITVYTVYLFIYYFVQVMLFIIIIIIHHIYIILYHCNVIAH